MSNLAKFPKSGFVLPCPDGQNFVALPGSTPDGRPAIRIGTGSDETGHAEAGVPLDQLEEVIAGLREIARQQGATARPTVVIHDQPADEAPIVVVRPGTEGWIRA